MANRTRLDSDTPLMTDPSDADIHGAPDSAYPESPKGEKELYTDGGDVDDGGRHAGREKGGVYRGIREKGLEEMSEAEYKAWMKGQTQD